MEQNTLGTPNIFSIRIILLSTLPVRHWRAYTEGTAYRRYLPKP